MSEYPFKSATAAIVHAFNDERHGGARPASARLADKRLAEPPAFGGADGGAEKATAQHMLTARLSRLHVAALRARFAPRTMRCSHCNSMQPRLDWLAALREISDAAGDAANVAGNADLRFALVKWHYEGRGETLDSIARRHSVSVSTANRVSSAVGPFLRGAKKGKDDAPALQGIDQAAMAHAEEILRAGGFIE